MTDEQKLRQYLRKATAELQESRRQLAAAQAREREPVAIIGIGCRFPGGVRSPEDLWALVDSGVDAVGPPPTNRGWSLDGPLARLQGGFLHDADRFDPGFFGIDETEALALDPQQRLVLETSWEAFERAGIDPVSAKGSRTAVYAGVQFGGYQLLLRQEPSLEVLDYLGLGNSVAAASGRVSYLMGLLGGSLTVDTGCSSSLVAVHLACKALRNGECTLALAGGAVVMSLPNALLEFRRRGSLAPDCRSKSFAAAADGVSLSEGAGMLLLERLSDARRKGHPILGVIRGTAINQDGATNGMASPSGKAQVRVIRQALADAGLSPEDVDIVEGHGVGATLGDGVEANALIGTYGTRRPDGRPLLLGSVKSNIGHTQAVGAIAGITKLVMALRHGRLPRTLHVDEPTSQADWSAGTVRLLTEPAPWPRGERIRRAGLSCLTIVGTNGHLILEEPPVAERPARPPHLGRPVPWVLSAKSAAALREQASRLREQAASAEPADVGFALQASRPAFRHRAVVVGTEPDDFVRALDGLAASGAAGGLVEGDAGTAGTTALLFAGMRTGPAGGELYRAFPAFAAALDEVCAALGGDLGSAVRDRVLAPAPVPAASTGRPTAVRVGIATAFALDVSLFRLLRAFGLAPDVLTGLGAGEAAAAHAAGTLSLTDACALTDALGLAADPAGAAVRVEAGEDEVRAVLDEGLVIGSVGEPAAVVVTGPRAAVARLADRWGPRATAVPHPAYGGDLTELRAVASRLAVRPPEIPVVSGVTGRAVTVEELRSPEHWLDLARRPGRRLEVVRGLRAGGVTRFVDLGPSAEPARRCAAGTGEPGQAVLVTAVLPEGRPEPEALLTALGELYADGVQTTWAAAFDGWPAAPVELPTYPFQRRRYWLVPPDPAGPAPFGGSPPAHPLLGAAVPLAGAHEQRFASTAAPAAPAGRQQLHGTTVLSTGGLLDWALAAAGPVGEWTLREVTFGDLVPLPGPVPVQAVREAGRVRCFVEVGHWREQVGARVEPGAPPAPVVAPDSLTAGLAERDPAELADRCWRAGGDDAPAAVSRLWGDADTLLAWVELGAAATPWMRRAAAVDVGLRLTAAFGPGLRVATFAERVAVHGTPPDEARVQVCRRAGDVVDMRVLTPAGEPLVEVEGIRLRPLPAGEVAALAAPRLRRHELTWQPLAADPRTATVGTPTGAWLVHGPDAERYAAELATVGLDAAVLAGDVRQRPVAGLLLCLAEAGTDPAGDRAEEGVRLGGRAAQVLSDFLRAHGAGGPTVVVCSAGAVAPRPGDGSTLLPQAVLTGLVRAAVWDFPAASCVQVDLDPDAPRPPADQVLGQALRLGGSGHLAVRAGRWYEARLREEDLPAGDGAVKVHPDAAYLVAGGTAAQSEAVAGWLAAQGARSLVLVGTGAVPPATGEDPVPPTTGGGPVPRIPSDVHVARVPAGGALPPHLPPVRGVIHLGEPVAGSSLAALSGDELAESVTGAVRSAWQLHRDAGDVDFFVVGTALTSLPGMPGSAVRTIADAVIEELVRQRRREGLPALGVAWGPWAGDPQAPLLETGVHSAPAAEVLDALGRALAGSPPQVGLGRVDWRRFRAAARLTRPYVPIEPAGVEEQERIPGFGQNRMNLFRNTGARTG